jgi:hypothetical protein
MLSINKPNGVCPLWEADFDRLRVVHRGDVGSLTTRMFGVNIGGKGGNDVIHEDSAI